MAPSHVHNLKCVSWLIYAFYIQLILFITKYASLSERLMLNVIYILRVYFAFVNCSKEETIPVFRLLACDRHTILQYNSLKYTWFFIQLHFKMVSSLIDCSSRTPILCMHTGCWLEVEWFTMKVCGSNSKLVAGGNPYFRK